MQAARIEAFGGEVEILELAALGQPPRDKAA